MTVEPHVDSLPPDAAVQLEQQGFVVIPGPVPRDQAARLGEAYDVAVAAAAASDLHSGRTSTRVNDFVNRGPAFDGIYVFPPLLDACGRVIGGLFKLSSLHARTVHAHAAKQELHVDVSRDSADWPLLGFILMVDDFRPDNGATRFVPGSHLNPKAPAGHESDGGSSRRCLACGPAGSLLIFHGSVCHGHSANTSDGARRSIQGAFIPRTGRAGTVFSARMTVATRARLSPVALHIVGT
jgi:hypothetical protein